MIKFNSKVKMHYSIANTDKFEYETTFEKDAITFNIGDGVIPQRLEAILYGLKEGDEQELYLKPIDAFGLRDEKNIQIIPIDKFSNSSMLKIGNVIEFNAEYKNGKNNLGLGTILKIDDNNVTLDLNHPLAGFEVIFKVKILKVDE
ncbi:MAG: peptidylprolyl isomerase [Gammaproteobacteria bacterium]|nr:peptidylprolyl isomerase [Gammaproteobacteria bacterium]|tara:strand:+ start:57339 stop:57776 length:438 start_codon:yes stop_codon:yes gene_type:complete